MQTPDIIARNLERLIDAAGTNPSAASKQAGLGHTAARDIITGKTRNPTMRTLKALADVLGIKVQDITGDPGQGFAEQAADYAPPAASVWREATNDGPSRSLILEAFGKSLTHPEIYVTHTKAPSLGNAGQERLRANIPMRIRLEIKEILIGGEWKVKRRGRSVVEVLSPSPDASATTAHSTTTAQ